MDVALRLDAGRIIRDGPLVAEQRFRLSRWRRSRVRRAARPFKRSMDRSCVRGRASQRLGLVGLASLRKKTGTSAGCFSASRQRLHWRASRVSGLAGSQLQVTKSARRASAANRTAGIKRSTHSPSLYLRLVFLSSEALGAAAVRRRGDLYFLYFFGLTRTGLLGPDEPRYAAVGRAMAETRRLGHASAVGRALVREAGAAVLDDGAGI